MYDNEIREHEKDYLDNLMEGNQVSSEWRQILIKIGGKLIYNVDLFNQFCNKFTYKFVLPYALIFSSDTLQVFMLICPSISELRFYVCFYPCFR